jgi:hypothetical protein
MGQHNRPDLGDVNRSAQTLFTSRGCPCYTESAGCKAGPTAGERTPSPRGVDMREVVEIRPTQYGGHEIDTPTKIATPFL